jgi:hypothetical protein
MNRFFRRHSRCDLIGCDLSKQPLTQRLFPHKPALLKYRTCFKFSRRKITSLRNTNKRFLIANMSYKITSTSLKNSASCSGYGTSENAVKTQIWIAVVVYVQISIIKKRLKLRASLYTILQILSVTIFEKMSLIQVLSGNEASDSDGNLHNQLVLFD